jgi:hypothetical protein
MSKTVLESGFQYQFLPTLILQVQKRRKTDSSTSVSAEEQLVKFAKEEHDLKMTQLRELHKAQMEIINIKKNTATLKQDMTMKQSCNATEYGNATEYDNYTLQQL